MNYDPTITQPGNATNEHSIASRVRFSLNKRSLALTLLFIVVGLATYTYTLSLYKDARRAGMIEWGYTFGPYYTDFYGSLYATNALLVDGRNPYSAEVTAEIQRGYYGHALTSADPVNITNAFVYPLYFIFLLAPLVLLPIGSAFAAWYGVQAVLMVLMTFALYLAFRRSAGTITPGLLVLLALASLPATDAILDQQPTLPAVLFLALTALALARERYGLAGVLLALSTIKPQISVFFVIWLLAWALIDWRRRGVIVLSFGASMALLLGASFALMPTWFGDWLAAIRDYQGYGMTSTYLNLWGIPAAANSIVFAVLGTLLAVYHWRTRGSIAGSLAFNLGFAATGVYTLLYLMPNFFYNQLLLFPAILLLFQSRELLSESGKIGRMLYALVTVWTYLPWIAVVALVGAKFALDFMGSSTGFVIEMSPAPWVSLLHMPLVLLAAMAFLLPHALQAQRSAGRQAIPVSAAT